MIEFISILIAIVLFCYFLNYKNKKYREEQEMCRIANVPRTLNVRSENRSAHNRDFYTGKVIVTLKWSGNDNLDFAAFILDETGKIASYSDFVFYNSKCKNASNFPSNSEGTVFLAEEHALYIEEEHTDYNCEAICIDFDRIDADKVSDIELVSCNYDKERAFKHLDSVEVCICDADLKKVWGAFTINNLSKSKGNALDIGSFVYDKGKCSWIFKLKMVIRKGWWNEFINIYT